MTPTTKAISTIQIQSCPQVSLIIILAPIMDHHRKIREIILHHRIITLKVVHLLHLKDRVEQQLNLLLHQIRTKDHLNNRIHHLNLQIQSLNHLKYRIWTRAIHCSLYRSSVQINQCTTHHLINYSNHPDLKHQI